MSQVEIESLNLQFHHIHCYVDSLADVATYKKLEATLSSFVDGIEGVDAHNVASARKRWESMVGGDAKDPAAFLPAGQDLPKQMICGLGWRLIAEHHGTETRSVVMASCDSKGAKFVFTAKNANGQVGAGPDCQHFAAANLDRFYANQAGRQGFAVLAFECAVGGAQAVYDSYKKKHPALLVSEPYVYDSGNFKVAEVFAYYNPDGSGAPAKGTVLRFLERAGACADMLLPGLSPVDATFDKFAVPAYSDHWVSNVFDRNLFLKTLEDTLGFSPKVDFNAGVVAAGAAQIESTVTGNNPPAGVVNLTNKADALVNQQQIYLPTNNDLGGVGHVCFFLKEIGQGIQHIASRVSDLVSFVSRVNTLRQATGEGFSFLRIPRSYYGRLDVRHLVLPGCSLDQAAAEAILTGLVASGCVDNTGIVDLEIQDAQIEAARGQIAEAAQPIFDEHKAHIVCVVKRGRIYNLRSLLGDNLSEETLVRIARNQVLVDIQGQDILYQIFTCNVMLRETGQEAPFLEFIERVCSEKLGADGKPVPLRPGCGGFGIRNFLTLFLSIEVSKAMLQLETALDAGKPRNAEKARCKIAIFTNQLDESNPILTTISDAMTAEGDARLINDDKAAEAACAVKDMGSEKLKELSARCLGQMQDLDKEYSDVQD